MFKEEKRDYARGCSLGEDLSMNLVNRCARARSSPRSNDIELARPYHAEICFCYPDEIQGIPIK